MGLDFMQSWMCA